MTPESQDRSADGGPLSGASSRAARSVPDRSALLAQLRAIVGPAHVLTDAQATRRSIGSNRSRRRSAGNRIR